MLLWRTELRTCLSRFLAGMQAMCGWSMECKACLLERQSSSRPLLKSSRDDQCKKSEHGTSRPAARAIGRMCQVGLLPVRQTFVAAASRGRLALRCNKHKKRKVSIMQQMSYDPA